MMSILRMNKSKNGEVGNVAIVPRLSRTVYPGLTEENLAVITCTSFLPSDSFPIAWGEGDLESLREKEGHPLP